MGESKEEYFVCQWLDIQILVFRNQVSLESSHTHSVTHSVRLPDWIVSTRDPVTCRVRNFLSVASCRKSLLASRLKKRLATTPRFFKMENSTTNPEKVWRPLKWSEMKVAQSCLILCDPVDDTIHGILQARILEWVAFPFSRGSSQPRGNPGLLRCRWILYQLSLWYQLLFLFQRISWLLFHLFFFFHPLPGGKSHLTVEISGKSLPTYTVTVSR